MSAYRIACLERTTHQQRIRQSLSLPSSVGHWRRASKWNGKSVDPSKNNGVIELTERFVYEFERCSSSHQRGDSYRSYVYYNIALMVAIRLNLIAKGHQIPKPIPQHFTTDILPKCEREEFIGLAGTLTLSAAHVKKRRLLDFFYKSLDLVGKRKAVEIRRVCEHIYERDLLWNCRDLALFNNRIKPGVVYRTSSLTFIQTEPCFRELVGKLKIRTVLDLRDEWEIRESRYDRNSLRIIKWISAPFDRNSLAGRLRHKVGHKSVMEIEQRFFMLECKPTIKKAMEAIAEERKAIAIHCEAGKTRTGVVVALIYLLSGVDRAVLCKDYVASEMGAKSEYLDVVFEIVENHGGIDGYLRACGVTATVITKIGREILMDG